MSEVSDSGQAAAVKVPKPLDLAYEGAVVRYLEADGRVSAEICEVVETGMRNNRVVLVPQGTSRQIKVNRRRLLPPTADRAATVVEAGDRYKALCPRCGKSIAILTGATEAECPADGKFPLHWLGVKPMSVDESNTGTKAPRAPKAAKPPKERAPVAAKEPKEPKPEPAKKARPTKEPQAVDMDAIAALGELYTKQHVAFDHAHVNVQAHILLVGARKHCFNTYNGSLGKRAKQLDMAAFQSPDAGFAIKDMEKEKSNLEKQGYERVVPGQARRSPDAENGAQGHAEAPAPAPAKHAKPAHQAAPAVVEEPAEVASVSGADALEDD